MIGGMIPLTMVVRNGSAKVEGLSNEQLAALGLSDKYWDYTFGVFFLGGVGCRS